MFAVPPSPAYANYVDWRVIAILLGFMLCVAGLRQAGVFDALARAALAGNHGAVYTVGILVALPFGLSMLVTNDVALIVFVPFALAVLVRARRADLAVWTVVLQTIAANMGSMLTPFGNPQNLFIYEVFHVPVGEFFAATAPVVALNGVALVCCVAAMALVLRRGARVGASAAGVGADTLGAKAYGEGEGSGEEGGEDEAFLPSVRAAQAASDTSLAAASAAASVALPAVAPTAALAASLRSRSLCDLVAFGAAFALCVLCVLGAVDTPVMLAAVCALTAARDRHLFACVDWLLLGTFLCFFIFSNNLAAIPAVSGALTGAMATHPFLIPLVASQGISNVPAAALLAPFTQDWTSLLLAVDMGGLGTPVASLASLIALGFYRQMRPAGAAGTGTFVVLFLAFNAAFLALNCAFFALVV